MSKIVINPVTGGFNLSTINSNFQKIADELNNKVLYRDNPVGEPNEMKNDIDTNGKRIYNLPKPIADHEPMRWKDGQEVVDTLNEVKGIRDETLGYKNEAQDALSATQVIADKFGDVDTAIAAAESFADASEASAVQSGIKADESAQKANLADLARIAAENARDASIAAAGPLYATEAEGRAAVADNETFNVQGSGFIAARVYRRISATESVLLSEYPSASIDSITVNKGKPYPYQQRTRGGITSPINTDLANFLLDVRVIGADPSKVYQIAQFTNGVSGLADRWQIVEYSVADFTSGAAGTTIKFVVDPAPALDRTQSVQRLTVDTRISGLVFEFVVSPTSLPAYGTQINTQNTTHNGYSWVIHPSCLVPAATKVAIVKEVQDQLTALDARVTANITKTDGFYKSPENRDNRLQRALRNPFESVRIRLIGDSITWGMNASNISPTDPRTGYLTDPRNTTDVSSPSWVNLLRRWISVAYNSGNPDTIYAPGSAGFILKSECYILSGNKDKVTWSKGSIILDPNTVTPLTNSSSKTGKYIELITSLGSPEAFEFSTTAESVDIYYAALTGRPDAERQVDISVDGVLVDSFFASGTVATWNVLKTLPLDGKRHTVKIGLAPGAAHARILGIETNRMIRIANDGIIGSSVSSWNARDLTTGSIDLKDTHVIVQLGTNDRVQSGASVDKFTSDLDIFYNKVTSLVPDADVTFLVANITNQDESVTSTFRFKMQDVDNIVRNFAAKKNLGFLSQFTHTTQMKMDGVSFLFDLLHPNDVGHRAMFENVRDKLLK